MKEVFLSVAGFIIRVVSEDDTESVLEEGYSTFILNDHRGETDVLIRTHAGISAGLLDKNHMLFEARDQGQDFFSIHKHGSSYKFIVYDQKDVAQVQQVAVMNESLYEWRIYCSKDKSGRINPLLYPMGPLMLYYITVRTDSIMLHSSGVNDNGKGFVFSGFSGEGKSTMARLWQNSGSRIINDDRLIIRKTGKGYSIYNTPMYYVDISKESPLDSIFLIYHSPENRMNKISGAAAVSRIMANCIQHSYNNVFIQHHLDFLSELCEHVSVYEVGFKQDIEIVDFIRQNAG